MKHVKQRNDFLNDEFNWKDPVSSIQELIEKVKKIIPRSTIDKFIDENREKVEQVAALLRDEKGDLDYNKTANFIKENIKKNA
jgi:hypothetical protein